MGPEAGSWFGIGVHVNDISLTSRDLIMGFTGAGGTFWLKQTGTEMVAESATDLATRVSAEKALDTDYDLRVFADGNDIAFRDHARAPPDGGDWRIGS